ncbi:hypothetical protein SEUCBS139899_005846 [Sporothrix eucalyptigena]|uniref:Short-chain dehydrogenase/reductase n=1 Tax=Sporothrix eucalyptigena TaxID=1812306 RepID=A0ABP0CBE1_9PEZI
MVSLKDIRASNGRLNEAGEGVVAVFLGATSGIGLAVLKEFAQYALKPNVYFVARNAVAAASIVEELRHLNADGKYEVIEKDVSLVADANAVAAVVKAKESKVDLLFMSVGFFSFDGRKDTSEGLEASMTTRYYSRIRIAQLLLPLLNAAPHPRVVSVLAGGLEAPIDEKDLSLSKPNAFSVSASNNHTATMMTLSLEHLAQENPHISFVHTFPGLVSTPLLGKTSSGLLGVFLRWVVAPLMTLFTTTPAEAGERGLFYSTSARYGVDDGLLPLSDGLVVAKKTPGGIFLVDAKGESADNEKVLGDLRKRNVGDAVWTHTQEVFSGIH